MGSVAASGGYWISMNASHITASPFTLTGSIGVIGSWFFENGLNSKLGLTSDFIQYGDHADLMSGIILPRRDLSPREEERYKGYILDLYGDFTARVAKSRNMEIDKVESIAQGRVFSGVKALENGLIDSIGGLGDAIRIAKDLAKISEKKKVLYDEYPKPKLMDKVIARMLESRAAADGGITVPDMYITDMFFPMQLLEELRYRIAHNGQVMPILPIDSGWQTR
jgi:protease-4